MSEHTQNETRPDDAPHPSRTDATPHPHHARRRMTKAQKADRATDRKAKRSGYERGSRSYIMSQIRGKDTSIETLTRSYLFRRGLRFRKNDRRYPGHPDIVLPKYRTMVFINGCFWHMHGCASSSVPKSNVEFWTAKLTRNRDRDARQHAELEAQGWRVIVVWECELKTVAAREKRLRRLYDEIVAPLPSRADAPIPSRADAPENPPENPPEDAPAARNRPNYSDSGAA